MAEVLPAAGLYGRRAELSALHSAVVTAADGQRSLVLLEGEAGIGKSRLLAAAVAEARDRGFHAAVGRGEELERSRPFGVIADALGCTRTTKDPLRRPLADLLYPSDSAARVPSSPPKSPATPEERSDPRYVADVSPCRFREPRSMRTTQAPYVHRVVLQPVTPSGLPCQIEDHRLWFSERPAELEQAKTFCGGCPDRAACLAGALLRREYAGVWGGEIFDQGNVVAFKRPRGRPRKHPLPAPRAGERPGESTAQDRAA